jgi:hypothetical protein
MSHPSSKASSRVNAFLARLGALVDSLPTASEREDVVRQSEALVNFLRDVHSHLASMPTQDDFANLRQVIDHLQSLLRRAESTPGLRAALGLPAQRPSKARGGKPSGEELMEVKKLLPQLEELSVDDLKARLRDGDTYSVTRLRALGSVLGIRSRKLSRDALVHQITMKIANYRGYQRLGGDAGERALVSEPDNPAPAEADEAKTETVR